eukprot:12063039-Heterocapsa_arctica.AAC.1
MAVRKSKVKQWAMNLNDGRFSLPETLEWEIAARGEFARLTGKHFPLLRLIVVNVMKESITKLLPQLR